MGYELWLIILIAIGLIAAIAILVRFLIGRSKEQNTKTEYTIREHVGPGSLPYPYFNMQSACPKCGNNTFQLVYGSKLQCAKCHHRFDADG